MPKSKSSTKKLLPDAPPAKKAKPKKAKLPADHKESLEALLKRLGIADNWDILVIGDGSGSNWNREAGWSAVSIERITGERQVWYGAMNRGTVNFAEIMAYLQPLGWLSAREEEKRSSGKTRTRAYRVHIITDSDYCRQMGSSGKRGQVKNAALWAAFDVFRRQGFVLFWHWIPRASCGLNEYSDSLSKLARLLVKKYNLQERLEEQAGDGATVYEVNPSESE